MMLKLDKRVWFFLVGYLSILVGMALIFSGKIDRINKIGLTQGISLILLIAMFSSQKMLIGLKPNLKVYNYKYVIPFFIFLFIYALTRSNFLDYENNSFQFIIFILMVIFIQTLTEEMVFRGVMINNFLKNGLSVKKSILYSSLWFGSLHLIAFFGKTDPISVINQIMMATMIGVFLGAIFVLSKNIFVAGIFHMLINIPAYFNRISKEVLNSELTKEILQAPTILETVFTSFLLVLIYSPFLWAGLFLLSKINNEKYLININNDSE